MIGAKCGSDVNGCASSACKREHHTRAPCTKQKTTRKFSCIALPTTSLEAAPWDHFRLGKPLPVHQYRLGLVGHVLRALDEVRGSVAGASVDKSLDVARVYHPAARAGGTRAAQPARTDDYRYTPRLVEARHHDISGNIHAGRDLHGPDRELVPCKRETLNADTNAGSDVV